MLTCLHACVDIHTEFPSSVFLIPLEHQWTDSELIKQTLMTLCVYLQSVCTESSHLPVKDNAPDEAQCQLVVPIYNICSSYVH